MGLDAYAEDQMHRRTRVVVVEQHLDAILAVARPDTLLNGIGLHCDTMFNVVQLQRIDTELEELGRALPQLAEPALAVRSALADIVRDRGYLWISGD